MILTEGQVINATGCITTEKALLANATSLDVMESLLGFRKGRFIDGVAIGILVRSPREDEFELAGYNQVATHKIDPATFLQGIDGSKLKKMVVSVRK